MNDVLFSVKDLTLAGSHAPRLQSVTLQFSRGITAIVGLSGAGKTSLLNILAGFETEFSGEFTTHLNSNSPDRLPLFWVPQGGGLWPHLSAEQHIKIVGGGPAPHSTAESAGFSKRSDEFLSLFDLAHRRQALPAELSQGERSRLALARALATKAKVVLLDEPLSHVDPVRKPGYWKIVRQIVTEENISMIFTSHEPETVLRQAEHVICLQEGSVVFEGIVKTLYNNPADAQIGAFLGPLNWFSGDDVGAFLGGGAEGAIRPERLRLCVADSSIELVSTPFIGSYCESIVRHVESGRMKTVLHQSDVLPAKGDRVVLRRVGAVE